MTEIQIASQGNDRYEVTVTASCTTRHVVTCTETMIKTYAPGTDAETLLRASFEFLLEREPNTAILSSFELPVIERYFSDYRRFLQDRFRS